MANLAQDLGDSHPPQVPRIRMSYRGSFCESEKGSFMRLPEYAWSLGRIAILAGMSSRGYIETWRSPSSGRGGNSAHCGPLMFKSHIVT